jgi:uncharacterized membrane protein
MLRNVRGWLLVLLLCCARKAARFATVGISLLDFLKRCQPQCEAATLVFMQSELFSLIARFSLPADAGSKLWELAGLSGPPADFAAKAARLFIAASALLIGAGAIFWVAANWQQWGRMAKFGLLEGGLVIALIAAFVVPRARTAALLLATLLLGALLAYIGQTYQTGADPWTLFAIWAALAVPWLIAARSDYLWVFWVLIVATAIALWTGSRPGDMFAVLFYGNWTASLDWLTWFALVAVALVIQRLGFAGDGAKWTLRVALIMALMAVTSYAGVALFASRAGFFVAGLAVVGATAAFLLVQRPRDFAALCVAALGVDVLLIAGVGRALFLGKFDLGLLLLFGLAAAGIVGATVTWLLKLHRGETLSLGGAA